MTAAPLAGPAAPAVALRPHALAYVASLPAEVLDDLRTPRCWEALTSLADLEARCEAQRDLVSGILHRAVSAARDREQRRRLLRVRRALYRGRLPADARGACGEATALHVEDRATLLAYCLGLAAIEERERDLDRALEGELALAACRLPAIADAHEPLLAGIALVSPELHREAARALAARRSPTSGHRPGRAELAVARYLLRAVTKISAYSTFTAAARTTWTDEGPAFRLLGGDLRQRRTVALNQLAPTVLRLTAGGPPASGPYGSAVALSDLDIGSRRCVFQRVDVATPAEDPVAGQGGDAGVAGGLRRAGRLASGCATLGAARRAAAVVEVRRSISEALRTAGLEPDPELTRPPVYEHAELADAEVALGRPAWDALLRDLRPMERSLPLWDQFEPLRPAATARFVDAFGSGGTCHDVLSFLAGGGLGLDAILADPLEAWLRASGPDATSARVRRRRRRRGELIQGLLDALGEDPVEVGVDGEWLAGLATGVGPGVWTPLRCHAYTGHLGAGGDLVLRTVTDGWGRRLAQHGAGPAAEARVGRPLVPAAPPGHEFAELSGTFGFNANAHPPMTPRRLLLPGDDVSGPHVLLTDLVLTHDAGEDRLRLRHRRDGVEIAPLYLGVLAPRLLGPLHRALLPLTQVCWTDLPIAELAHRLLDRTGDVRRCPRVRLGSVVLSRRTWIVPAARWPEWPPAHAMRAPFLRRLERWRRRLGLPEQVFVRPMPGPDAGVRSWKPQYIDFRSAFVLAAAARRMRFDTGFVVIEEALPAPEEYTACGESGRCASSVVIETEVTGDGT